MELSALTAKDCQEASFLHQQAFTPGWKETDFYQFLRDPQVYGFRARENKKLLGYILGRKILDEAEILTLVVAPSYRCKGIGGKLLLALCNVLKHKGIKHLFLEVAEDNREGLSFYTTHGFILLGKRPAYYPRENKPPIPALNLRKDLV